MKWILETPGHLRDPDLLLTKPKARYGQIRLLSVRNVTGDERAHARNKSSIFDVLNNEFDRAVKFFSDKTWLYAWLFFVVFVLFNIKFNVTVTLNFVIIVLAKTSKQYASTSTREFFTLFKSLY